MPRHYRIRNSRAELVWALARGGELEEARAAWEKYLERDPPDHDSWHGYAQLWLFLGNEAAYRRNRKAQSSQFFIQGCIPP